MKTYLFSQYGTDDFGIYQIDPLTFMSIDNYREAKVVKVIRLKNVDTCIDSAFYPYLYNETSSIQRKEPAADGSRYIQFILREDLYDGDDEIREFETDEEAVLYYELNLRSI